MTMITNVLPVAALGIALAALATAIFASVPLRRRLKVLNDQMEIASETNAQKGAAFEEQTAALRERIEQLEQKKPTVWDWMPEPTSVNLNRRGHVLRLLRRGDSPAEIASALGLSRGEVMLIVKVHELSRSSENS